MKKIKNIYKVLIVMLLIVACTENERDLSFIDNIALPTNIAVIYSITQDNTGTVTITPTADGAVSFNVFLGDETSESVALNQGESANHVYKEGTYNVKVEALNLKGETVEITQQLIVSFTAPQNLVVVIENDAAISRQVNITANADFAATFDFDSGETGVTQPVLSGVIGNTVSYQYQNPGTYAIKVIAKGGAIETTEYSADFEVTEILAPITSAPRPGVRNTDDVISIFSDAYTDVAGTDFYPNWGQSTQYTVFDLNGDAMIQYSNLNYQGIDLAENVDASAMEVLHIDIWTPDATTIDIFPLPNGIQAADEKFVTRTLIPNQWNRFEIPMSEFTSQGLAVDALKQFKFVGSGTVFLDNIYFYKAGSASSFLDGLLTNGDFENGSDSWIVGVNDNSPINVVTDAGNSYYSVNVTAAGNSFDVNMSQKVEIIEGNKYTLTFDAWSDIDRSIISGIGLSGDPWSNSVETVNITPTRTTYSLTLTAAGFGATNARVIFDLGAAIGVVNIDNVSLFVGEGNLLTNSNFENGSDSWIVGVDDTSPVNVVTDAGNSYYSVNVTAAGNSFDVNMSQKVEIIEGTTYTLTFDAWSDINRPIISGIGLSGDPWSNTVETVEITPTRTTYSLTLTAAGFGATNARVIFDLGAAIGMVNIDDVTLSMN